MYASVAILPNCNGIFKARYSRVLVCFSFAEAFLPGQSPPLILSRNPVYLEATANRGIVSPPLLPQH